MLLYLCVYVRLLHDHRCVSLAKYTMHCTVHTHTYIAISKNRWIPSVRFTSVPYRDPFIGRKGFPLSSDHGPEGKGHRRPKRPLVHASRHTALVKREFVDSLPCSLSPVTHAAALSIALSDIANCKFPKNRHMYVEVLTLL